jgi:hypothetical protein
VNTVLSDAARAGWIAYACIRKLNTSPSKVDDQEVLKKLLVNPPIKKIDLQFPLGLTVVARNPRGVTIKDALDAIHKQFKKKVGSHTDPIVRPTSLTCASAQADDELDAPYLAGFEWDREECYTKFIVHQKKTGEAPMGSSKKSKKNKGGDDAE